VDYRTDVPRDAALGYRVIHGTLTDKDGVSAVMQASYRIAPVFDIDLVRVAIKSKPQTQVAKLSYYLRSNTVHRLDCDVVVVPPSDFRIQGGNDKKYVLAGPRGSAHGNVSLEIPAAAQGTIPVTFKIGVDGKIVEIVRYINVE